jgi:hypothetical protein
LGRHVPWIELLDVKLAETVRKGLWADARFPSDHWLAPWHAYVRYSDAYNAVGRLLKEHYLQAIRLGKAPSDWHERTGYHIACFLIRGIFDANDLEQILTKASPEALHALLNQCGDVLPDSPDKFPDGMEKRTQEVSERIVDHLLGAPALKEQTGAATELLASKSLPLEWRLKVGARVLNAGIKLDYRPGLVDLTLEAISIGTNEALAFAVPALRYLLKDARGTAAWQVRQRSADIRNLLGTGKLPAPAIKVLANEMVAGGFLDFRDLAK